MVDKTFPDLTALGAEADPADTVAILDVSDTTDDAAGTNKEATIAEVRGSVAYSLVTRAQNGSSITRYCGAAPITGTVTKVEFLSPGNTSSDASNLWTIQVQNHGNSDADFLAAAYDTNAIGDLAQGTVTDLGALHGTAANLEVTQGDPLRIVWTETGAATSLFNDTAWVIITILPS
jgi:hypothetical protein